MEEYGVTGFLAMYFLLPFWHPFFPASAFISLLYMGGIQVWMRARVSVQGVLPLSLLIALATALVEENHIHGIFTHRSEKGLGYIRRIITEQSS